MKSPHKTLNLTFGVLTNIAYQLREQKFKFDKDIVAHYQKDLDAINRLRIRGMLTNSHTGAISAKLYKKIETYIMEVNKLHKI